MSPAPLGLDLSLTATGVSNGTPGTTGTISAPKGTTGLKRMRWIRDGVLTYLEASDLVVVEGPSYGSTGGAQHDRAGLWWLVADAVDRAGLELIVVPPSRLKRFATGAGNADKDRMMLATARAFDWFEGDNNAADALWLSAIGHAVQGRPLIGRTQAQLEGLTSLDRRPPS